MMPMLLYPLCLCFMPGLYLGNIGPLTKLLPVLPTVLDVGEEELHGQARQGEVHLEEQQTPEEKEPRHPWVHSKFNKRQGLGLKCSA